MATLGETTLNRPIYAPIRTEKQRMRMWVVLRYSVPPNRSGSEALQTWSEADGHRLLGTAAAHSVRVVAPRRKSSVLLGKNSSVRGGRPWRCSGLMRRRLWLEARLGGGQVLLAAVIWTWVLPLAAVPSVGAVVLFRSMVLISLGLRNWIRRFRGAVLGPGPERGEGFGWKLQAGAGPSLGLPLILTMRTSVPETVMVCPTGRSAKRLLLAEPVLGCDLRRTRMVREPRVRPVRPEDRGIQTGHSQASHGWHRNYGT